MFRIENIRRTHWLLALFWTLFALFVLWQYDPVQRKLDADASFMLYAGQQILRGHAPYAGVAIVKLPVSPLAAALGIGIGRAFGVDDILAGRIMFWLCAGITVGAVYFIAASLLTDLTGFSVVISAKTCQVLLGSASAIFLLSFQTLGVQVAEGPEAKLPMICAGMLCAALLARQKFFWAGLAGALSFLAWQPGLIFAAVALLCALVVPQRKRAFAETLAGITLPMILIGAYLALNGAFGSMLRQAFGANANYLGEKKVAVGFFSVLQTNASKVWDVSLECSKTEIPFVVLGFAGILGGAVFLVYYLWRTRDRKMFLSAFPLLASGIALFGFSLLDLQKCSDLIPLLPYLALGASALFISLILLLAKYSKSARLTLALGILVLVAILIYGVRDAFALPPQNGLPQQRALAQELSAQLQPNDRVQQFGDTVFLVITRRENATRFVHLGEKQGLGILTAEGVSIDGLIRQLQGANPRVITVSRAKAKDWASPLYDWIALNYTQETSYSVTEGGTKKDTDVWWKK